MSQVREPRDGARRRRHRADTAPGTPGALFDSGIVVAAVVAVVFDLVLPGRPRARQAAASAAQ
ncbi:hypothetical protein LY71_11258 [Geodermatophilus tzadiensis]|uniref:Uncharacterized protein n=1 Tax=Geodermatophilus tzadiensis TaxID=1137988 RepID=A0A2T0TPX9_9ACTN|nr:hypothetical protein LY71_11258 [Geodermatophilus tzadiensis]